MKKNSTKSREVPKMRVMIHPFSQGYLRRAMDDWNKRIVKQQGSIILPGGIEGRPGGTYDIDPGPEVAAMIEEGILMGGSKIVHTIQEGS